MRIAFVVDPLDRLKPYKDSSIAMMREAARRGHEVHALEAGAMYVSGASVMAPVARLSVHEEDHPWHRVLGVKDERSRGSSEKDGSRPAKRFGSTPGCAFLPRNHL